VLEDLAGDGGDTSKGRHLLLLHEAEPLLHVPLAQQHELGAAHLAPDDHPDATDVEQRRRRQ